MLTVLMMFMFVLSGCSAFAPSYEQLEEGQKARTFLAETNKGTDYELTSKPEKPVLINFWRNNGDVVKCQSTTSPTVINSVPFCNMRCPEWRLTVSFFNKFMVY